jgi:uncharacterized membrane protein
MRAVLEALRASLGIFVILFAPGYSLQAALFPRAADLETKERLGLAFALSVAVSSPLVWILDRFPGGLGARPVALAFIGFSAGCTLIAIYRRGRLAKSERLETDLPSHRTAGTAIQLPPKGWFGRAQAPLASLWQPGRPRPAQRRPWALGLACAAALAGLAVMAWSPGSGEGYTEFYILGQQGMAEDYPREATPGQAIEVVFGITNREGRESAYRVEVFQEAARIGAAGPYRLEHGEGIEAQLAFTPARGGEDGRIEFVLFRDGRGEPYRRLELLLAMKAPFDPAQGKKD